MFSSAIPPPLAKTGRPRTPPLLDPFSDIFETCRRPCVGGRQAVPSDHPDRPEREGLHGRLNRNMWFPDCRRAPPGEQSGRENVSLR